MYDTQKASDRDLAGSSAARRRKRSLIIFLVIVAVIGFGLIIYASRWGLWAFSDGVGYMVTARNLVQGNGFGLYRPSGTFVPSVMHPPLLAFLIALLTKTTGDVLLASRLLGAALIAALLVTIPLLFRRLVGLAGLTALLAILLITHPAVILMFLSAMSEPLFVFSGTTSLLIVGLYLTRPRPIFLALACVFSALAMLTRYVGLAYVITGGLALLFFDGRGLWRQRLARAAAYSAAGVLPTLIFLVYWMQTPFARTVRGFALPTSVSESIALFVNRVGLSLWSWKPVPTPAVLATVLGSTENRISMVLILMGLLFAAILIPRWLHLELATDALGQKKHSLANTTRLLKVFSLFVLVFLGMMFLAFTFSLPRPDIDSRTLFPLLPTMLIILIGATRMALGTRQSSKPLHWLAAGLLVMFAAGSAPAGLDIVAGLHRTGLGFTAKAWHESETMEFVDGLNPKAILVSNSPEAIMLYTGRSAHRLPSQVDEGPSSPESAVAASVSNIDQLICNERGFLVLFDDALDGVDARVNPDMALNSLSCEPIAVFQSVDGAIYRLEDTLR